MTYLLDVNVLLALIDPLHLHGERAHDWFTAQPHRAWATCPITEIGFLRILTHPAYSNPLPESATALAILRDLRAASGHQFWPDDITIADSLEPGAVVTHNQITDIYLLALAARRGGKLATLDTRIPAAAVTGGVDAIEIIPVESAGR